MKVCIIGTGSQGTGVAGLLSMESDVEKLVLADYSQEPLDKAMKLIGTLGDGIVCPDISTAIVDAGNTEDVAKVIEGCDIVFNGIVPRFNIPIMKACIRQKCHYLDLFANPYEGEGMPYEETITAQLDLDEEFIKAGRLALPSIGVSPGWTSIAADYLVKRFDSVDSVILRWADQVDSDVPIAPISPITLFLEWFGAPYPVANINGKATEIDLIESREEFEFPDPIGKKNVYTVTAHPDVLLIPEFSSKYIPYCEEKGSISTGGMSMEELWIRFLQKAALKQGAEKTECNILEELSKNFVSPMEYSRLVEEGHIKNHHVCFSCEVNGLISGRYERHICFNLSSLESSPWRTRRTGRPRPGGRPAPYPACGYRRRL